jgi:hypothetical protein
MTVPFRDEPNVPVLRQPATQNSAFCCTRNHLPPVMAEEGRAGGNHATRDRHFLTSNPANGGRRGGKKSANSSLTCRCFLLLHQFEIDNNVRM